MYKTITILLGGLWGVGLIVVGLWAWQGAGHFVQRFEVQKPALMAWAVRSAAVAALALAQAVLLTFVANGLYRRDLFTDVLRLSAAAVSAGALVAAVALGVVGR